jgi:hypothetical protein
MIGSIVFDRMIRSSMKYALASIVISTIICCACAQPQKPVESAPANEAPAVAQIAADPVPAPAPPENAASAAQFPSASEHADAVLTSTIIDAPNGTFGYDIFSNGKLFLHQTNLPGQPGNSGCKTKADAEKLAAFVIGKIKKGEMPPTVTTEELKTLGLKP